MNREELAWAAGFFDGEGSTFFTFNEPGHKRLLRLTVVQTGEHAEILLRRFQAAIRGVGRIYGPWKRRDKWSLAWQWTAGSFEQAQAALAMLWPFLGPAKRAQARQAILAYLAQTT